MPQISHTAGLAAMRGADEQFLDVICADEDLVRAEFDAIIAAEWPSPPPARPDRGADAERRPCRTRQRREASVADLPSRPRHPGIGGWTRQRSPPPTPGVRQPYAGTTEDRKVGDRPT
jgi:hypothetical protein